MRRLATPVLLALGLGAAGVPAARAQLVIVDYVGFDYESPIVVPGVFGGIGNGYQGVGETPVLSAPLVTDPTSNQYTYFITGLTATTRTVNGTFAVIDYTGPGTLTVYEDSKTTGTPFDYGVNPPNGTVPSSFTDGTPILVGAITNFRYILDTATNTGNFESDFEVTGGTQFGNIPPDERKGWQFAGVSGNSVTNPPGYAHQVDGQALLQLPTPTRSTSWGQLKRRYR